MYDIMFTVKPVKFGYSVMRLLVCLNILKSTILCMNSPS